MMEVAVLLSLMIGSSAEDSQICLNKWNHVAEVKLKSDVLLDNVRSVIRQIKVRVFLFVFFSGMFLISHTSIQYSFHVGGLNRS